MNAPLLQPAIRSYFFGKGFADALTTLKRGQEMNLKDASGCFETGKEAWGQSSLGKFKACAYITAACFIMIFGSLCFGLISTLHLAIVALCYLVLLSLFGLVRLCEQIYLLVNRLSNPCPACHAKIALPVYLCSHCKIEHSRLVPGRYGMLRRTCQCGEKLPTTFFNGRSRLEARCPACPETLDIAEKRPLCLPVVGGPGVGKTCFMLASTYFLREQIAARAQWNLSFVNPQTEREYHLLEAKLLQGVLPNKTANTIPRAFNYLIAHRQKKWERLVYLYDAAGEAYKDAGSLADHRYYDHLNGLVLLLDPFSLPEVADRYAAEIARDDTMRPSLERIDDIFDRLVINLEQHFGVRRKAKVKQACAIVLGKVDAFDLATRFGQAAVDAKMAENPGLKEQAACDQVCREFLKDMGGEGLLQKFAQKFQTHRFFACSTLELSGASPAHRPDTPLLWLMSQADGPLASSLKPLTKENTHAL